MVRLSFNTKLLGTLAAAMYSITLGLNYIDNHNLERRDYETGAKIVTKIDGAVSETRFTRSRIKNANLQDVVSQGFLFGRTMFYIDGGEFGRHDGKVDFIVEKEGGLKVEENIQYSRDENYNKYSDLFDKADKKLYKQKMRFREYFDFEFENENIPELPKGEKW